MEAGILSLESRLTSVESVASKLAPLLPIVETIVGLADPAAGVAVKTGVTAAEGVAGVLTDLLTSLNQHFGVKLSKQIGLPAPAAPAAAVTTATANVG